MSRITSLDDCARWALSGAKPRDRHRIGTEYERLCVGPDGAVLPYDGTVSIRALLDGLADRFDWTRKLENGQVIALVRGDASITLEPAGQLELSGAPLLHVAAMMQERDEHLAELRAVAEPLGVRFAYVGMNPIDMPTSAPKMPKSRYGVMRRWMPTVGTRGLDMMHLTCTVQANIDYTDEDDAMTAFRLGYLATPVIIALFANSPWRYGEAAAMATARADTWLDVDPARCDPGPWVFERGATLTDYARWAAGVPMYFLVRDEGDGGSTLRELPVGFTFMDLIAGKLPGVQATVEDWETHAGTLFPDVRIKKHLEIRAADCVPPPLLPALPALVEGLFYDPRARARALDVMRDGDASVDRSALRAAACEDGLQGAVQSAVGALQLRSLAIELVDAATEGVGRLIEEGREKPEVLGVLRDLRQLATGETTALHEQMAAQLAASPSLLAVATAP